MKKGFLYKLCAVVLMLTVFVSIVPVYAFETEETGSKAETSWTSKVDAVLLEKMQECDGKIPVWLWMEDIDKEDLEERVYEKTGLTEKNLDVVDENISQSLSAEIADMPEMEADQKTETKKKFQVYLEKTEAARKEEAQRVDTYLQELRTVQADMCREKNKEIFSQLGIPEENIIISETMAPVYIVYIEKTEIQRIAENSKVTAMYYYEIDAEAIPDGNELTEVIASSTVSKIHDEIGLSGEGVNVGIIDVGRVSPNSEILQSRITYIEPSSTVYSDHATDVARIAAGSNGVAPKAHIYSASGQVLDAITNMSEQNVNVANFSRGYDGRNSPYMPLEVYVDYTVERLKFTLVKTAGNEHSVINCPGLAYNVITVGGFFDQGTADPSDDIMYDRSNYDSLDGCSKPDLVANQIEFEKSTETGTRTSTGTSFAAPFVTGVIALLYELKPSLKTQPEAVKAILMASCHRKVKPSGTDPVEEMSDGWTDHQGAGAIDPYRAVAIAAGGQYGIDELGSTEKICHFLQPKYDSSYLNVAIAWSHEPHSEREVGYIQDIDLDVPYDLGVGGSDQENSSTEMAYIPLSNTTMNYTIEISKYKQNAHLVKYAYAWSTDTMQFQPVSIEGIYYLKNKYSEKYMDFNAENKVIQNQFTGNKSQQWVITKAAGDTANYNVVGVGSDKSLGLTARENGYQAEVFDFGLRDFVIKQNEDKNDDNTDNIDNTVKILCSMGSGFKALQSDNEVLGSKIIGNTESESGLLHAKQSWYLERINFRKGDLNRDGVININDIYILSDVLADGNPIIGDSRYLGDMNADGTVNSTDLTLLRNIVNSTK